MEVGTTYIAVIGPETFLEAAGKGLESNLVMSFPLADVHPKSEALQESQPAVRVGGLSGLVPVKRSREIQTCQSIKCLQEEAASICSSSCY